MMGEIEASASGRWWEYYFIRYFFGTVIGAALVALFGESIDPLKKLIPSLISDPHTAGAKDFTILIACGLAYCYVASAPMLVLHTMRVQLFAIFGASNSRKKGRRSASPPVQWLSLAAINWTDIVLRLDCRIRGLSRLEQIPYWRYLFGVLLCSAKSA